MIINWLDERGQIIPAWHIDIIELEWYRKWFECGTFILYMTLEEYLELLSKGKPKYIQIQGNPETGIIQKINYNISETGNFYTMEGYFSEKLLDGGQSVFDYVFPSSGNSLTLIDNYLKQHINKDIKSASKQLSNLYGYNLYGTLPVITGKSIIGTNGLGTGLYNMLKALDYTYSTRPRWLAENEDLNKYPAIGLDITFKQGRDLTKSMFFGREYGNVRKVTVTTDESATKARYRMYLQLPQPPERAEGGDPPPPQISPEFYRYEEGEKFGYISETVTFENQRPTDVGKLYPEKEMTANVSGIEIIRANETQVRQAMRSQAEEDVYNNNCISEDIEIEAIEGNYKYRVDFDLGDLCTFVISELNQTYQVRIVEAIELYKENRKEVTLKLGNPKKISTKARR